MLNRLQRWILEEKRHPLSIEVKAVTTHVSAVTTATPNRGLHGTSLLSVPSPSRQKYTSDTSINGNRNKAAARPDDVRPHRPAQGPASNLYPPAGGAARGSHAKGVVDAVLVLWPRKSIAHATDLPINSSYPTGFTVEHNASSKGEVDAVMEPGRKGGRGHREACV